MSEKITTFAELQEYAKGQIVRFPDFAEGQPFVARITRPSMMALAKQGKIPNSLLGTANKLFMEGSVDSPKNNKTVMTSIFEVLEVFCEACFIQPTYAEIKNAGITLTDEQMMFVFNYAQSGVRALDSFREQPQNSELPGNSTEVHN